ncbi:MAG TPA: TonB-dependent receptor [Candidatus Acidoferrales bacterium]|nr:TonB-dependent receptor [Candidatus Acidoferrales bacterium]
MCERLASRYPGMALLVVLACGSAFSQTAEITGRVMDASGAVIPRATVSVNSIASGAAREVQTNSSGYYTVPLLLPGEYQVSVQSQGFKTLVRSGVVLAVDQRAELDLTLEVGGMAEKVEVQAAAPQLNTVEASQGQVIANKQIVDLPLNGRTYDDLALLSAGTVQPLSNARFVGFSSGGMRDTQNNFLLDGVDNNPVELAGAQRRSEMVQPSIDGIQEFKVQTNSFAAEYGRALGAVVNVTTKSGTNELHGSAFEFLRNEKLDAENFFAPPGPKPPFKRNQYGFSVGGPVFIPKIVHGKNRLFFFGDYEGTKIRQTQITVSTIPTPSMRTGDFTELNAQRKIAIIDPGTGSPFPNNVIPSSRLDPLSVKLVNLYPAPMTSSVATNFTFQSPSNQDVNKFDVRGDANLGSKDNMFWRMSQQHATLPAVFSLPAPAYGGNPFDSYIDGINTGATWNHIFTPTLILSVRGGWNYGFFARDNPASTRGQFYNQQLGLNGGTNSIPGSFSNFNPTGYASLGLGPNNPVYRDSQNRQLTADVTWTHGKHSLKFGGSLIKSQNNIFNIRNEIGGPYAFNGQYTKDGMADFLLGMVSGFTWNTRLQVNLRSWNDAAFIQDDWKITPNLTLNLGLRYEVVLPFVEKRDRIGDFDNWTSPSNPQLVTAKGGGSRYERAMTATDKNNFMPRVGFAYKLGARTVIRSGYGIFYSYMEPLGDAEWLIGNLPFAYGVTLNGSTTSPAFTLANGLPPGALDVSKATGVQLSSIERQAISPYAQQWNFNIQRDFGGNWLLEVGYAGSRGTHLERVADENYSPPGPGAINAKRPYQTVAVPGTSIVAALGPIYGYHFNGNTNYNALVTRLEKRFSQGLTLLASYTFSKAIGDICGASAAGDTTNCGYQDPRNLRNERSVDNIDIPQRFVGSGVYQLPVGRGRHFGSGMSRVADGFIGGWALGSIFTIANGMPFSVISSGNPANTGTFSVVNRPNVTGDPYAFNRTVDQDFNTAVFVNNAPYTLGTAGRNIMRQRGFFNWDFSANKEFAIRERIRLQFRFESFHFTNTPRFGVPGATLGTAAFGKITSADTPRNQQLGLKLVW